MEPLKNPHSRDHSRSVSVPDRAPLGRLVRREPVKHVRPAPQRQVYRRNDLIASILAAVCFCLSTAYMALAPRADLVPSDDDVTQLFHSTIDQLADSFKNIRVEPTESPEETIDDPVSIAAQFTSEDGQVSLDEVEAVTRAPSKPVVSKEALTAKVRRIIRLHSPRNRNPNSLAEAIVSESVAQDYDPLFVAAVIKSESTFNNLARSHKGAQGLMQLMPRTGAWLADMARMPRGDLTDPGYNLRLGITYLKKLQEGYGGDRIFTLIAYNWGPGRVESAADGRRRVPPEVMGYAIKILNDYRRWGSEVL